MAKKLLIVANMLIVFGFLGALTAFAQVTDTTAPIISGVATSNITQTGATISWTTDEAADGQVEYGTSTAYGLSSSLVTATTTAHQVTLGSLTASTTYHYLVKSKDVAGNLATSTDYTFTTLAVDATAPIISGVSATGIGQTSATINWTTDESADGQVEYGTSTVYGLSSSLVTATTTAHSISLAGLTASTAYHYVVKSKDVAGNLATSTDYTFTTLAPTATTTAAVAVRVKVEPRTLNAKNKGKWIEAEVVFPKGYNASQLDIASIKLNGTLAPVKVKVKNAKWYEVFNSKKAVKVEMKFSRADVINLLLAETPAPSASSTTAVLPRTSFVNKNIVISGNVGADTFSGTTTVRLTVRNPFPPVSTTTATSTTATTTTAVATTTPAVVALPLPKWKEEERHREEGRKREEKKRDEERREVEKKMEKIRKEEGKKKNRD